MEISNYEPIRQEILDRIAGKYIESRTGLHQSELIYCLTKSYYKRMMGDGMKPSDKDILTWIVGLGLEEVLLEQPIEEDSIEDQKQPIIKAFLNKLKKLQIKLTRKNRPEGKEVDGVSISPDYHSEHLNVFAELKTTRAYYNKEGEPTKGYPFGWIKQIMGYAYAFNVTKFTLVVYQIIQAQMFGKLIEFTQDELNKFWHEYILPRKKILETSLKEKLPPEPFKHNETWECNNCNMRMICEVITTRKGQFIPASVMSPIHMEGEEYDA